MNRGLYEVSFDELKALAASHGRKISRQWVSKYSRLGLLPPHNPPGLGPGKGRHVLYSRALADQLVPLIQALKRHGKNLDAVGWDLFWHGYFATPKYWRTPLEKAAAIWDSARAALSSSEGSEDETDRRIEEISGELSESKDAGRLIGAVKRHAPDELSSLLAILTSVLNGSYVPLSDVAAHDQYGVDLNKTLFRKILSIPIAASDRSDAQNQFPTDVEALDEQLHNFSQISNVGIVEFVASQSDDDIQHARNELALFMAAVSVIEVESQKKFGQSSGAKPILWSNQTQEGQVNILLGWLFQRRDPAMRKNIESLNATIVGQIRASRETKND